jgi:sugar/nucleoside kinase (ribokinase family)
MEAAALARGAGDNLERSAEVLLGYGCQHVVITQSARGCTVFHRNEGSQDLTTSLPSTHQDAFHVQVRQAQLNPPPHRSR